MQFLPLSNTRYTRGLRLWCGINRSHRPHIEATPEFSQDAYQPCRGKVLLPAMPKENGGLDGEASILA